MLLQVVKPAYIGHKVLRVSMAKKSMLKTWLS